MGATTRHRGQKLRFVVGVARRLARALSSDQVMARALDIGLTRTTAPLRRGVAELVEVVARPVRQSCCFSQTSGASRDVCGDCHVGLCGTGLG